MKDCLEEPIKSRVDNDLYVFDPFRLDVAERRLVRDGKIVPLAGKAFDLLLLLVESAGHLKTRETLIEALWPTTIVEENSLSWYVSALRKALGDTGKTPHYIETVRGQGYRFIAPVEHSVPEKPRAPSPLPHRNRRAVGFAGGLLVLVLVAAGILSWWFIGRPAPGGAERTRSIAVLPFENLSKGPANAYFVAGIQDTILTKLSGIADLRVTSRTSTERYPSHPQNLRKVARELGVATVLEGSVQKAGDRVLVNVQLIDAASDNHIWAQAYTRKLDNVFAVESDVAEQVAAALKAKLLPAEKVRVATPPTHDPKAYDLFLRANYLAMQVTDKYNAANPAAITIQAIALFHQAIARDPNFALAWARLSYLESRAYWRGITHTPKYIAAAEKDGKRALALAPNLGEAHLAVGYAAYYGKRDYAVALAQFKQAEKSMPNDSRVLSATAYIHLRQGDWRRALATLRKVEKLDPQNPRWPFEVGSTLAFPRHYRQANQQINRALAIEPYNFLALTYKVWIQLLRGHTKQAERTIADIDLSGDPNGQMSSIRFEVAKLTDQPRAALQALAEAPSWIEAPDSTGQIPVSLLRAQALDLIGNKARAHSEYAKARTQLKQALEKQPDNADLTSALAAAEAGLGEKAQAIRDGKRATQLVPIAKDFIAGPLYLINLAKIYDRLGEIGKATKLLGKLLAMPAGLTLSVPLLRLDPIWNPIRNDPRFQRLLKKYSKPSAAATQ